MTMEMPTEFYGDTTKSCGFTLTDPRKWTAEEIEWVEARRADGHTYREIAEAIGRTKTSVEIKMKRRQKKADSYNVKHRDIKYAANDNFIDHTKPESVLDLFAGNSYYLDKGIARVVTNDKDERFETDYHTDALALLCQLYADEQMFDVVDLDPYGSAYDCFDLAIKMARKGMAVSFGEWGHKRWRRYDYVRTRYGITTDDEFTRQAFIDEIRRIAINNKKTIEVIDLVQYGNFLRVYLAFDRYRITEQWEEKE